MVIRFSARYQGTKTYMSSEAGAVKFYDIDCDKLLFLPFCRANLSVQGFSWFMRNVVLNIVLFLVLIFLTTPTIILNTMDKLDVTKTIEDLHVR